MNTKDVKRVLIVDDIEEHRTDLCSFFQNKNWLVSVAGNGEEALIILKSMSWECDCIILDMQMPIMGGKEFLINLSKVEKQQNIPIIILSAYLDNENLEDLYQDQVISILKKPQESLIIEAMASNIRYKMKKELETNFAKKIINMQSIDSKTRRREDSLSLYYNHQIANSKENIYELIDEHLFVVARRWNSWYPSYFDVPGGCYSIVCPLCEERKRNRVIAIDPGFRFLKVLENLNISVKDIETCIISHNHPDHLGGSFEYIASRHAAKERSNLICNPSSFSIFTNYKNSSLDVNVLGGLQSLISCNKHPNRKCDMTLESFDTDHQEIGSSNESKGIVIEFPNYESNRKIVILGDTAFDLSRKRKLYLDQITNERTKIAVLHIGSSQLKERINGHLYLQGLHRLLTSIGEELEIRQRSKKDKLIVLISEWGLEHATKEQINNIAPGVTGFEKSSPIIETLNFLNSSLADHEYDQRMVVLPADIGLMVGVESGKIFWIENGVLKSEHANKIQWKTNELGLVYFN